MRTSVTWFVKSKINGQVSTSVTWFLACNKMDELVQVIQRLRYERLLFECLQITHIHNAQITKALQSVTTTKMTAILVS